MQIHQLIRDADGSYVVLGFYDHVDLGDGPILGDNDAFIARLAPDLQLDWVHTFYANPAAGLNLLQSAGMAIDDAGNIVVVGRLDFAAQINFLRVDGGTGMPIHELAVDNLAQLVDVAALPGGDVIVLGRTWCAGPGCDNDIRLTRVAPDGGTVWQRTLGEGFPNVHPRAIAAANDGTITIAGIVFGTLPLDVNDVVTPGGSVVVVHMDGTGADLWATAFPVVDTFPGIGDLVLDPCGGMVVYGEFSGDIDFGPGLALSTAGGTDLFLAHIDDSGATDWAQTFGGVDIEHPGFIAVDDAGRITLTGQIHSAVFGNVVIDAPGTARNGFVAHLDRDGVAHWAYPMTSTAMGRSRTAVAAPDGSVLVGGTFTGSTDIGGMQFQSAVQFLPSAYLLEYTP